MKQIYETTQEIEANETEVIKQYIEVLREYETILAKLKQLSSVNEYIIQKMENENRQHLLNDGLLLSIKKSFGKKFITVSEV